MTPAERDRRSSERRKVLFLVLGLLVVFLSAPIVQRLFDLTAEGILFYRLGAVVLLIVGAVLTVRASRSRD